MNRVNALHVIVDGVSANSCVIDDIHAGNNTPISPLGIFDFHTQEIDEFAFLDYETKIFEKEVHRINAIDLDSIETSFLDSVYYKTDMAISEKNIQAGYKSGFIDIIKDTIHLESDGWYNKDNEKICEPNVSIQELKEILSWSIQILPHLETDKIREMDNNGVVTFDGKTIAFKTDSSWTFVENGRQLSGDAMRVLHHSDCSFTYSEANDNLDLYHAVTMSEEDYKKNGTNFYGYVSRGNSKQGDGLYLTGSLNEAVRVYGNPESFERKSHAYANKEEHLVRQTQRGVLHKVSISNANIYDASFDNNYPTLLMDSKPSPILLRTIANKYDIEDRIKEIILAKTNSMIINSSNQFDVYLAVSEFASSLGSYSGNPESRNVIKQVFSAMGYDGIKITPPNQKKLNTINEIATVYKDYCSGKTNEILYDGLKIKPFVAKHIASYSVKVRDTQIPKMENCHIIMFSPDNSLCKIKESITLPKHKKYINERDVGTQVIDDFYDLEKGSLDKLSFKQIKSITHQRDNGDFDKPGIELTM